MGHLFRALNFISLLKDKKKEFIVIVNDDETSREILKRENIPFHVVGDLNSNADWESAVIKQYHPKVWINDRLETRKEHGQRIKYNDVILVCIDDLGDGAESADLHFALMPCFYSSDLKGRKIFKGMDYFILNSEIKKKRRKRTELKSIIVTLGGSDTYGVTIKIAEQLKSFEGEVTIITGPSFAHGDLMASVGGKNMVIKNNVPSLIEEFFLCDLAITGGGVTPFEANAAGLPCLIVANEEHEVLNGKFLDALGSSLFCGRHLDADIFSLPFKEISIESMSSAGISRIPLNGAEKVYDQIVKVLTD